MTRMEAVKEFWIIVYDGAGCAVESVLWWLMSVVLITLVGPLIIAVKPEAFFGALEKARLDRLREER